METNINILQKRIENRAEERFNKEFKKLAEAICNNQIGRILKVGDNILADYGGFNSDCILNADYPNRVLKGVTNIDSIKDKLVKEYIKEETDNILSKLSILSDFIEPQG